MPIAEPSFIAKRRRIELGILSVGARGLLSSIATVKWIANKWTVVTTMGALAIGLSPTTISSAANSDAEQNSANFALKLNALQSTMKAKGIKPSDLDLPTRTRLACDWCSAVAGVRG